MDQIFSDPVALAAALFAAFVAGLLIGMALTPRRHDNRDPKTGRYVKRKG